ncbi:MAG: hypothetical protein JNM56_38205 [Planctomycetia bacterium]|nr:hypothetical protein [Planctomycetia bacterium]
MTPASLKAATTKCRAIVGLESQEDFRLLFRLATILHRTDRSLPDLQKHAKAGAVLCVPFDLSAPNGFVELFLNFDMPQLYLFSRGTGPMPEARRELIRRIRQDPGRSAVVMRQRALTNYLHPDAIYEEFHTSVAVNDDTDVPVVVLQPFLKRLKFPAWDQLDPQLRTDLAAAMAMELSVQASRRMTAERLAQRDPNGEVAGWLKEIGKSLR